jgi:hypothetical protein
MPEVQKGDDVEQDHAERHDDRDAAKPREHELALAGAGWRSGNANSEVLGIIVLGI